MKKFWREPCFLNLKAGVIRADWFDCQLNPKIEEFARHYGTVILPTKPAIPRHKSKVGAGVKYAQNNAVKGRSVESLAAQNSFLGQWESNGADTRIHGTTRQQVGRLFESVGRPAPYSRCPQGGFLCLKRPGARCTVRDT